MSKCKGIYQLRKIQEIREMSVETNEDAKIVITKAIDEYEILPFIPLKYKFRIHNKYSKKEPDFVKFWDFDNGLKKKVKDFFFGKDKQLKWEGDLRLKALDMKEEMVAKILLEDKYENEFENDIIPIKILAVMRPLTISEYMCLLFRYSELEPFIKASLGITIEEEFNKIFQETVNKNINLEIAHYLADIYI